MLNKIFLRLIPARVSPNHLTIVRFFLTPLVVILLWLEKYAAGMGLFLLAAFTDALDGSLASVRRQVTDWGKIYDPLADKLLVGSVVYVLVAKYIDVYAAWVIIILEAIIIISAWLRRRHNKQLIIQANGWGKTKMLLQVGGIAVLFLAIIFNLESLLHVSRGTFYLAIAFGIISLFSYSF